LKKGSLWHSLTRKRKVPETRKRRNASPRGQEHAEGVGGVGKGQDNMIRGRDASNQKTARRRRSDRLGPTGKKPPKTEPIQA